MGFLGSFVQQVGFEPPTVCVAVGKGRAHLDAIRASGRFALSVIDDASAGLMGPFFKPAPAGASPFDDLDVERTAADSIVLSGALAWLDCKLVGEHATGDHVVVFGEVVEGKRLRDGDPKVHVRKNGLSY